MSLHRSGEMYLETIFILSQDLKSVRALDVSEKMNFSKPSVSRALKLLVKDGYIEIDSNGYITLSDTGRLIAAKMFERHTVLTKMLVGLGVDEETAAQDACRIEHEISDKSFNAIKEYINK